MTKEQTAQLHFGQNTIDLQVHIPTLGLPVVDVQSLHKQALFTYDPGFMSTAACESKITYIDGDQGILLHRGYPIKVLAEHSDYMEVSYLLIHGELPKKSEKQSFEKKIREHSSSTSGLEALVQAFDPQTPPMAMLLSIVAALATPPDLQKAKEKFHFAYELLAKMPIFAAFCHRRSLNAPLVMPNPELSYSANFLYMLTGKTEVNPVLAKALDRILILHADHEQNASTSTVRLAGSTGAPAYAAVAAGIAALWGPAHGGANEACLQMLMEIGDEQHIPKYVERAKDKDDPFRLMGFGHRVYKNYDPRAEVMRETCHEVLDTVGAHDDPLFKIALKLEKIAREDEYFVSRKLYPNVDFYSGITLRALGIPKNMFTVLFALGRTVGWVAQWLEMTQDKNTKIGRPRQLYTGYDQRSFVPIDER